jgi:hypothetical protein
MSKKMLFLVPLLIVASSFLAGCNLVDKKPADSDLSFTPTLFEGMLALGSQINKEYCADGVYFSTGEETYLLRTNTENFELYRPEVLPTGYISLPLELPADDVMYCEALTCECEKYATVLSGVENSSLKTEDWLTYSHPAFSINYPPHTTTETASGPESQVAFTLPRLDGPSAFYPQLSFMIVDNPENLILEEMVPYYWELNSGEDRKSVSEHIHISDDQVGGEYALKVVQDGGWWQGSGAKTIHVIPYQDKVIFISSQLQEGFMDNTGQFRFNDTVYTPVIKKMLDSFVIVEK